VNSCLRWLRQGCLALTLAACATASAQEAVWVPLRIEGCDTCTVTNLHFVTPQEGWASARDTSRGFYRLRTSDGGDTWTTEPILKEDYVVLQRAQFTSAHEGWAPADYDDSQIDEGTHGVFAPVRFYHTSDGGRTWVSRAGRILNTTYLGDEGHAKQADRRFVPNLRTVGNQVLVMAGELGRQIGTMFAYYRGRIILVSRDQGNSWNAFLFGDSDWGPCIKFERPDDIRDIEFVDNIHGWIPAPSCRAGDGHLFVTRDGGDTWNALKFRRETSGESLEYVEFATPSIGWGWGIMIAGSVYTADGGQTWQTSTQFAVMDVLFGPETEGWSIAQTRDTDNRAWVLGIFHSADRGASWQMESSRVPGAAMRLLFQPQTRTIWAIGYIPLRRIGLVSSVEAHAKLPDMWGKLKRK